MELPVRFPIGKCVSSFDYSQQAFCKDFEFLKHQRKLFFMPIILFKLFYRNKVYCFQLIELYHFGFNAEVPT